MAAPGDICICAADKVSPPWGVLGGVSGNIAPILCTGRSTGSGPCSLGTETESWFAIVLVEDDLELVDEELITADNL